MQCDGSDGFVGLMWARGIVGSRLEAAEIEGKSCCVRMGQVECIAWYMRKVLLCQQGLFWMKELENLHGGVNWLLVPKWNVCNIRMLWG